MANNQDLNSALICRNHNLATAFFYWNRVMKIYVINTIKGVHKLHADGRSIHPDIVTLNAGIQLRAWCVQNTDEEKSSIIMKDGTILVNVPRSDLQYRKQESDCGPAYPGIMQGLHQTDAKPNTSTVNPNRPCGGCEKKRS